MVVNQSNHVIEPDFFFLPFLWLLLSESCLKSELHGYVNSFSSIDFFFAENWIGFFMGFML